MRPRRPPEPDSSRFWIIFALAAVIIPGVGLTFFQPCSCDATADISGRIVALDGHPVDSAGVTLAFESGQRSTTTDSLGCFHMHFMHGPDDGRGTLSVTREGMKPFSGPGKKATQTLVIVRLVPASTSGDGDGRVGTWSDHDYEHDAVFHPCFERYWPSSPSQAAPD